MNGFVSNPPAPASPENSELSGDGWFPGIDLNDMRDSFRVGSVVTHQRLLEAVEGAWSHISDELWEWRQIQEGEGLSSLKDVSDRKIGDKNRLEKLFTRAVQCSAKAELTETHRDISATAKGDDLAEAKRESADDYRRMAVHAVRDIKGAKRTCVELI